MSRQQKLTETQRQERRDHQREQLKQAAETLLTSDGWQRWVRVRASFHRYSLNNTLLIALQRPDATRVAGFRAWLKLGRCVRKGEKAIRIWAPMRLKQPDEQGKEAVGERVLFRAVSVFDIAQTDPLPDVDPVEVEPPSLAITGDSHTHLLDPLQKLAAEEGYKVELRELGGDTQGWCNYESREIVVDSTLPANARVRVLVHELAHVLGGRSQQFGHAQAEVIVDTATYLVCAAVGLDTSGETVPYIAGWGEQGALEAVTKVAETIDELARRIENTLLVHAKGASEVRAA